MKKIEISLLALSILAFLFKLFHIPTADILLILSLTGLSCIYFYLGIAIFNNVPARKIFKSEAYKHISSSRSVGAILTGIALSMALIGIMFSLLHYPGAMVMLTAGFISMLVIFFIVLIKRLKKDNTFYPSILKRLVPAGLITLFLLLKYFFI